MKIYSAQFKGTTTVATGSNVDLTGSFSGSIAGIDINATNQFTASTSTRLTNIEIISASNINRITSLETNSASVDISISNINAVTASNIARLSNLETKSSSVDISVSNINSFTASNGNTSLNQLTGSLATTGSNTFKGTTIISGSTFIQGDFVVFGSSSIQYISASSVSIGTNIVQLNTANPAVRFGGLAVQDSGSAQGVTGSMLWDSCCNRWIYSNPSGIGYSGGIIMSGPRASTLGSETPLTCNYIAKSGGGDHLYDSCIIDDGTTVCVNANLKGIGQVCSVMGNFSCIGVGINTPITTLHISNSGNNFLTLERSTATNSKQLNINIESNSQTTISYDCVGGFVIGSSCNPNTQTGFNERLRISGNGIACFSCQVCTAGLYSNCAIGINSYNSAIPLQIKRWAGSSGTALLIGNDNVVGMPALSFCNDNGGGTAYVSMTSNCQININGSIYACPSGYVGIGTSSPTVDLSVKPGVDNAAIRVGTWAIMENVTTNQTMFGYNTAYATGLGTGWRYINNGYAMGIRMHDAYGSGDIMFHLTSCGTAGTNLGGTWDGTDLRMIIKNDGKVGIGTITPVASLHVVCVPSSYYGIIETTGCSTGTVKHFRIHKPGCVEYGIGILDTNSFHISTASTFPTTNGFTLTSGGSIGIGTTSPNYKLDIGGSTSATLGFSSTCATSYSEIYFNRSTTTTMGYIGVGVNSTVTSNGNDFVIQNSTNGGNLIFRTNDGSNGERFRINYQGATTITSAYYGFPLSIVAQNTGYGSSILLDAETSAGGKKYSIMASGGTNGAIGGNYFAIYNLSCDTYPFKISAAGAITIAGSLSKGSGSFRICHPLTSKKCTHQLVHSFIEGPNADLIYSGHSKLTNGIACINIDCSARMTQGTFESLNRCVRIFTTNETSWDAVRGKVCNNIVVIESQNTNSEDEISWMVIGERQDEHMYETDWTDQNGRVITEPENN